MNGRQEYIRDLPLDQRKALQSSSFDYRNRMSSLPVATSTISNDGTSWLHCVSAEKVKTKQGHVARIRVIRHPYGGVNITVPLNCKELDFKFHDLRYQVRNTDTVMITFPELYVCGSPSRFEVYLKAYDFKIKTIDEGAKYDETSCRY